MMGSGRGFARPTARRDRYRQARCEGVGVGHPCELLGEGTRRAFDQIIGRVDERRGEGRRVDPQPMQLRVVPLDPTEEGEGVGRRDSLRIDEIA